MLVLVCWWSCFDQSTVCLTVSVLSLFWWAVGPRFGFWWLVLGFLVADRGRSGAFGEMRLRKGVVISVGSVVGALWQRHLVCRVVRARHAENCTHVAELHNYSSIIVTERL